MKVFAYALIWFTCPVLLGMTFALCAPDFHPAASWVPFVVYGVLFRWWVNPVAAGYHKAAARIEKGDQS